MNEFRGLSVTSAGLRPPASMAPTIGPLTAAQFHGPKPWSEGQVSDRLRPRPTACTLAKVSRQQRPSIRLSRFGRAGSPLRECLMPKLSLADGGCESVPGVGALRALPFLPTNTFGGFLGG